MTRPRAHVEEVLALRHEGLGARRIARRTGIPIKTIQDWLSAPDRALARPRQLRGVGACAADCDPWANLDDRAYTYLLGMYLGDGYIVALQRCYRLIVSCDARYPAIIEDVRTAMSRVLPAVVGMVDHQTWINVMAHSQHWPCFFPQHGSGMKHQRPIVLELWQERVVNRFPRPFLRGLIHSDGWRGENVAIRTTDLATEYRTYTRYQFSNRSDDIRKLFCDACDLLGIHWTQSNRWTISVARRKDVHYMDSFVGPKR
jgi:hypothetical protein